MVTRYTSPVRWRRRFGAITESLRLYLLPSYSPELNPGEGVWREVKSHRLGRAGIFSFAEMKSKALGALRCLLNRPDIIRGFFHTPSTLYAS